MKNNQHEFTQQDAYAMFARLCAIPKEPIDICPADQHKWIGCKASGCPSEPDDYIKYCDECGMEYQGD